MTYGRHADDAERWRNMRADRVVAQDSRRGHVRSRRASRAGRGANANSARWICYRQCGDADIKGWQEIDLASWNTTLAVNLTAPFLLAQRVLPGMIERKFGRILFISSVAAITGGVVGAHYAASKAGLHGLMHYLAPRIAAEGVTINCLAPALVGATKMFPADLETGTPPIPIPVGRVGRPDEMADMAIAMLRNGYLTNKVITLDGGIVPRN